mmetsp:Transcript_124074/g.193695  ORF Transcript_124074/g.193695 Transcript_124074/m.193695 type:complete len:87 (-) Transcript_124074:29-289(-)
MLFWQYLSAPYSVDVAAASLSLEPSCIAVAKKAKSGEKDLAKMMTMRRMRRRGKKTKTTKRLTTSFSSGEDLRHSKGDLGAKKLVA